MLAAVLSAAGCASGANKIDPIAFHDQALEATDPERVGAPASGSEAEKAAIERWVDFFSVFTPEQIRAKLRDTYAEDVFFNDTLKSVRGLDALEHYLIEGAEATDECLVEMIDVTSKGREVYARWRMTIKFKRFKRGKGQVSIGMTHLRFDKEGKVVYHQDYWDSAHGLFEHVPFLGWMIRKIKARL